MKSILTGIAGLKIFLALFYINSAAGQSYKSYKPPCSVINIFDGITEIRVNRKNTYALFTPHLTNEGMQIIGRIKDFSEKTRQDLRSFLNSKRAVIESEKKRCFRHCQFTLPPAANKMDGN